MEMTMHLMAAPANARLNVASCVVPPCEKPFAMQSVVME